MRQALRSYRLLACLCLALAPSACTKDSYGYFPDTSPLEDGLQRGVSTEAEVIERLGEPTGQGAYRLPPDHEPRQILFYEDVEIGEVISTGAGEIVIDMKQNMLVVFILDGRFDGFMWWSNSIIGEGKADVGPFPK